MNEPDCDALLDEIGDQHQGSGLALRNQHRPVSRYEAILKKANEALVEITLQSQQQATALQEQASTLVEQNQELKRQATTDALTGLANRVPFDQFLAEQFAALRTGAQAAVAAAAGRGQVQERQR